MLNTSHAARQTVADHLPACVEMNAQDHLRTVPDGYPVGIRELTTDEVGDPLTAVLQVETGPCSDDWVIATIDMSEYASADPDSQFVDAMVWFDRKTAAALTDAADETLRAMAGDWVAEIGVTVRAVSDPECEHTPEDGGRGFEIVACMCADEVGRELWPNPYGDETTGRPLTPELVAQRAAAMLTLDRRVLDAWADQARGDDGEIDPELVVLDDCGEAGEAELWLSAAGAPGEDTEDWLTVQITAEVQDDGTRLHAFVWDGPQPGREVDVSQMSPRAALVDVLERCLGRSLPRMAPGDGRLARFSREAAACDE